MYIDERCVIMYSRKVFKIGVVYEFCDCCFVSCYF